jgi:DHA3 family tetracycline resistance protein-like MFS transporter
VSTGPARAVGPARVYVTYSGLFGLLFALSSALTLLYFATTLHLSPLQMVAVGSTLEASILVAEIPTGLLADLRSRRLSVLVGLVLLGAGFLLQALAPGFALALVAQVVWGVGYTFTSGADTAWITDEVGAGRIGPVLLRGQQAWLTGEIVGKLAAGGLALVALRLPLLVSGVGFVALAAVLAPLMDERGFTPRPADSVRAQLAGSARDSVSITRRRPVVRTFLLVTLLAGGASEAVDRLWPLRVLDDFPTSYDPVLLFTAISLVGTVLSLVVSVAAQRLRREQVEALHPAGLLATLCAVQVAGILGLALAGQLWLALAAYWLRTAAGELAAPLQAAWLARNLDSASRATALSLNSQADALGQVAGGPPLGAIGNAAGVRAALVAAAVLLAPTVPLYARLRGSRDRVDDVSERDVS